MNVFDFNVHLSAGTYIKDGRALLEETRMDSQELLDAYGRYAGMLSKTVSRANYMILNPSILSDERAKGLVRTLREGRKHAYITVMIDFRKKDVCREVERAHHLGFDGIKVHSYVQRIAEPDFRKVLKACELAQAKKMFVCVDTSYGTGGLFSFDNLKLAAYLSERVTKVPLVLLHSGAVRIWEAMLIAASGANIYLETSFSIPYLSGSSREADMAFCYKKIGADKIIYGSDFPFVGLDESLDITGKFFKKYRFNPFDTEKIFFGNAASIKERCI